LIDGDDIMAIAALEMLAEKTLAEKTLVATVMSNAGLEAAIKNAGGQMLRTAVGDKNVIDEMLRGGFNFGGEQSGHLIFRDHGTTGDGLVAALQILRILKTRETPLSQLAQMLDALSAARDQRESAREKALCAARRREQLVAAAEKELAAQGGRLLLRYSGTEPKVRLLVEGRDAAALKSWSQKICGAIAQQIGVELNCWLGNRNCLMWSCV
jgi:phosphoglucosamine mutase